MAHQALRSVLVQLRRLADGGGNGVSDADLLARFVACQDEAAFELLLHRHGPMVLGVCRRILRHEQDAEDAFQATFLVLARKAGSIARRTNVPGWLYRVAFRSALEVRTGQRRHALREHPLTDDHPEVAPVASNPVLDALDDAVAALPEKYRVPIVLCHLEAKTYAEAAELLGCPPGTLAVRLSRGRELLRKRLQRRGLAPTPGALTAALTTAAGMAPAALHPPAVRAALAAAAEPHAAIVSASVRILVEGVLKTMFVTKVKSVAIGVLAVVLVAAGAGLLSQGPLAAPLPSAEPEEKAVQALQQARLKAAQKACDAVWEAYKERRREEEDVYHWSVRLLELQKTAGASKAERLDALGKHLERMKEMERLAPQRSKKYAPPPPPDPQGRFKPLPQQLPDEKMPITEFYRIEAELWLEQARAGR
jgi:RNA polymerase sigma factor (sigma-70 family)